MVFSEMRKNCSNRIPSFDSALVIIVMKNDTIKVENEVGKWIQFPKRELIRKLYDCGIRYLNLLALLPSRGHEKSAVIYWDFAKVAETALKESGILA